MWADNMIDVLKGPAQSGKGLQLAAMTGPDSCRVGNLNLAAADLMAADSLTRQLCTKVSEITTTEGEECTDKSTYLPALKAGDTVLVCQVSETKFVILAKVVDL